MLKLVFSLAEVVTWKSGVVESGLRSHIHHW